MLHKTINFKPSAFPKKQEAKQSIGDLLIWAKEQLPFLSEYEVRQETEWLFEAVTGRPRLQLYMEPETFIEGPELRRFKEIIFQRQGRFPLAYLIGRAFFYNEELEVNENVLIPRPETEILVERFIQTSGFEKKDCFSFLDIGTGSGAIGIALLRYYPRATAVLSDVSEKALEVAGKNINRYGLSSRTTRICGDLFSVCNGKKWDAIVSNPPYVAQDELRQLDPEVLHEPSLALDGGMNGYDFYRRISRETKNYLRPRGYLSLEVGINQAARVSRLLAEEGFKEVKVYRDYNGIDRVVTARGFCG